MKRKALVLLFGATLFPVAALSNKIDEFSISNYQGFDRAPELEVYSTSGERWTDVDQTDMSKFAIRLNAECKWEGRGNKAYRGNISAPGFVLVGQKEPANFLIPHADEASGVFRWDGGQGQDFDPVQACNTELDKRVANNPNKTKYHFLADGFRVNMPAALRVSYRLTCKPTGAGFTEAKTKSVMINTRVKCSGSPQAAAKIPSAQPKPVAPKRARIVPLLKTASFEANPEVYTAACPATIAFDGTITANRAGTVKYRYVKHDGSKSPQFEMRFDRAGTKKTRAWQTSVTRPNAATTLSAGGADQNPDDIQGWYRLDVLSPAPKGSIVAHYRVMCGADNVATPARLQAVPQTRQAVPQKLEIRQLEAKPARQKQDD